MSREIHLKKADGTIIASLPAYATLYDVPLSRYIDFIKATEPLANKERMEDGEVNVARVLAKAVGEFFGVSLTDVLQTHYGEIDETPTGGLQSLYMWIAGLVGTFQARIRKAEDCCFDYNGERYTIPVIGLQALAAMPLLPDVETGQAIEAYEIKRIAGQNVPADDPDGSHLYSYYLQLIAVLALKEDEKLPVGESDCEVFINARAAHFADIDAGTALDVDFFLASLMRPQMVTGAAIGFLINHAFSLVRETAQPKRQSRKHSTRRSRRAEKSLKKSASGKSTSNFLKGGGSPKSGKVPLKP